VTSAPHASAAVTVRRARPEDAPACGQIVYEAFLKISSAHNFPTDFPSPERGVGLLTQLFSHPGFYCVVAEADGRLAGSNCLDERDAIAAVGPITIDPEAQNRGIGRELMDAVLDRARERKLAGVRLVQAAFHNRSLSLYTTLGFEVREPLAVMQGPAIKKTFEGFAVRTAQPADLEACNQVCHRVHGHHRGGELADAIPQGTALVVERGGRITGYASSLAFFGHTVAETNTDLQALIAAADGFAGAGILVPSRNSELFRWCLANGLRVVQPMTLMSLGLYNEPRGAFLPSVLY
jgi:ribosomal protein S18 acetylase RimI-like enzyme